MQIVIEEIVSNVRAVLRENTLSPESLREIVAACLRAVREERAQEARADEERSVEGVLDRRRGR